MNTRVWFMRSAAENLGNIFAPEDIMMSLRTRGPQEVLTEIYAWSCAARDFGQLVVRALEFLRHEFPGQEEITDRLVEAKLALDMINFPAHLIRDAIYSGDDIDIDVAIKLYIETRMGFNRIRRVILGLPKECEFTSIKLGQ